MNEKWIKWEPIKDLEKKYYIMSLVDTYESFKLSLSAENKEKGKLLITFKGHIASYRSTEETYYYQLIDSLISKYGSQFVYDSTFFKIENSSYLQWLSEGSYKISEERSLIHFVIIGIDSMMDIIAPCDPIVEIFTEP